MPKMGVGGAIYNTGNLTIKNTTINNNKANLGGAIYNTGNLTINNTNINNNNAKSIGGSIYNNGTITINNTTLTHNNVLHNGGAIYNTGNLTINNTNINNNYAKRGSALNSDSTYTSVIITITNSIFKNNKFEKNIININGNKTLVYVKNTTLPPETYTESEIIYQN